MTIFEVADGQITEAGETTKSESLQGEVDQLESFAQSIGLSLGGRKLERAVATFESRGFGIRYSTSKEETFNGRGVEVKGRHTPGSIVEKLY